MPSRKLAVIFVLFLALNTLHAGGQAQSGGELGEVRKEMEQLKQEYEQQRLAYEQRLGKLEEQLKRLETSGQEAACSDDASVRACICSSSWLGKWFGQDCRQRDA